MARREDKPTNQQTTDLFFHASLIELTPGAAAGIAPGAAADGTAGAATGAEAVVELASTCSPLWSRSTRPRSGGPGIVV